MKSPRTWHRKIVAYLSILILSLSIALTIVPAPAALFVTEGLHKIAPDLRSQMESVKNESQDEKISVIVMLEQHQSDHFSSNFKTATKYQRRQTIHSIKSSAGNSQKDVLALLEKRKVRGDIENVRAFWVVNALAVKATPEVLVELAQRPEVKLVELDYEVKALEDTLPWGVDRINAEFVWNGTEGGSDVVAGRNAGKGINISILDTGIDYNHPDLANNYRGGYDLVNNDADPMDDNGHGTHCAGIVAAVDNDIGVIGTAPEVYLYAVKVLGSSGSGHISDVVAGIQWSVDNNIDIISMSFGSGSGSMALEKACENAYNAGLLLVAAAGNDGNRGGSGDNVDYPARYDSVIAVAAIDSNNKRASFSSTGPAVELAAPGVEINSTDRGGGHTIKSGTSMACPHVTGTAALVWKAYPEYANIQVRERLRRTAHDLGNPGRDTWYGYGLVDAEEAATPPDTTPPAGVTDLSETALGETWINWTWRNPPDADFNHTEVWLNGMFMMNVYAPEHSYNATNLLSNTTYELGTRTVDNSGNVNSSWVNDTAATLADKTPPEIIISSPENKTYATALIHLNASSNELINIWMYNLNGAGNVTFGSHNTVTAHTSITGSEGSNSIIVYANDTAGNTGASPMVYFSIDQTPPNGVTNLTGTAGETWISWRWTNPPDPDFHHTIVYINGNFKTNTSAESYNVTGLIPETWYEIGTKTVDKLGNTNETWVNDTAATLPDTSPPASITNLANITGNFWIKWTWTNPPDIDFNHTMVYINGTFIKNISAPQSSYNDTYEPHATKTISIHTVDTSGNINPELVNQTATIPNNEPVLDSIGDRIINENEKLTIDLNAHDLDSDSLVYACNRTDLFVDFNSVIGKGNWTPSSGQKGIYYINFGVCDGYGGEDNETVTITVNDKTPPESISNLQYTNGTTWINWTWRNPSDDDFSHVTVYLNGTWIANTSNSFYNATGLYASTDYEIGTHTTDKAGNINDTWVNNTAATLPETTPPQITASASEAQSRGGAGGGGGGGGGAALLIPPNIPIDPATGRVTSTTSLTVDGAMLTIPAGTVVRDAEGKPLSRITSATITAGSVGAIAAYDFGPSGTSFSPPIDLVIAYDPTTIPQGFSESGLVIRMWDGTEWVDLDTTIDTVAHTATAKVSHFTIFALFAIPGAVTPSPAPIAPTVTPTVTPAPTPVPPPFKLPTLYLVLVVIIALVLVALIIAYGIRRRRT